MQTRREVMYVYVSFKLMSSYSDCLQETLNKLTYEVQDGIMPVDTKKSTDPLTIEIINI